MGETTGGPGRRPGEQRLHDDGRTRRRDGADSYWQAFAALAAAIERRSSGGDAWLLPEPGASPAVPALDDHQAEALYRLERGAGAGRAASGIVHLPTGEGSQRIALRYAARTLAREPRHRFLWATRASARLHQAMRATFAHARLFPGGTRISRFDGAIEALGSAAPLTFLTTAYLRQELSFARDPRSAHPWRAWLEDGEPLTLIIDESHELDGDLLLRELECFDREVVDAGPRRWRVIGLSATPLPRRLEAREVQRRTLFPLRGEPDRASADVGMNVLHGARTAELFEARVLCPVNLHLDRSGIFDVPTALLERVIAERGVRPPGERASAREILDHAAALDRDVIGHPAVIEFLADRLEANLAVLGKTVVFAPTVEAASLLRRALNRHRSCGGRVVAIARQLLRFAGPGRRPPTDEEMLARFRARGAEPCVLIDVGLHAAGLDDPRIRTVVLATLTLSTARLWRMIGLGTRGPASDGTNDCHLLDPIKLARLDAVIARHQPTLASRPGHALEDTMDDAVLGALDPRVPAICLAPLPSEAPYQLSDELRHADPAAAQALEAFLSGGCLDEQDALTIARGVRLASIDGGIVARPSAHTSTAETGPVLLNEELARMRLRMQADLGWLQRRLPRAPTVDALQTWVRTLAAVEALDLRTEHQHGCAGSDGRLARALRAPRPRDAPAAVPSARSEQAVTAELDVGRLCIALATADGSLAAAHLDMTLRVVTRLTGALDREPLRRRLGAETPTRDHCVEALTRTGASFDPAQRRDLVRGLVDLASGDAVLHPAKLDFARWVADALAVPSTHVDALLAARLP